MQDLKGRILVKGKKEQVEEHSSSSSDLSSEEEESSRAEGPRKRKEDRKVGLAGGPSLL